MPVDASIPMGINPPNLMTPYQAQSGALSIQQQMQNTKLDQMRVMAGQQELHNQMFLSQVASEPGSLDPKTGLWSQDAIDKIVKTNPILGRDLLQKQTKDKMQIETLALDRSKALVEDHKAKSEAINDEQTQAIAAADAAPADQREQVYAKEWTAGRDRLKKTGIFPDDVQFGDMSYKQAKEISMRRTSKENKNQVQQIEDARDQVNDLKTEYSHADPQSPQAKQLLQKIADGEAVIKKMAAPTAPMVNMGGEKFTNIQQQADGSFIGLNKASGKMEKVPAGEGVTGKDRRDVYQADALAAYRARYPMGYMPEVYKGQPTPEEYTADYIKNKEKGGNGMPQKDEITTRFEADTAMKGMTLGKKTPQGYEVMKDGKLIGHFN
jgi:hypothetical protein